MAKGFRCVSDRMLRTRFRVVENVNLEPLVGTLLGVFVLGESLGALGILGGALILFAAAYFSRPKAA